ncbi:hypothetical protein GCM10017752_00150 [Streptomyces roseoviridis]
MSFKMVGLDPLAYLLRALVTRNATPTMTITAMAMIQKGGEPCPAPLAKNCMCDMSFLSIRSDCLWQSAEYRMHAYPVNPSNFVGRRLKCTGTGQG